MSIVEGNHVVVLGGNQGDSVSLRIRSSLTICKVIGLEEARPVSMSSYSSAANGWKTQSTWRIN
jgi:hypothetical protein